MKRVKLFTLLTALLCVTTTWGWDGSGTSDTPYLIQNSTEWAEQSTQVAAGNAYGGQYFRISADINAQGVQVGTAETNTSTTLADVK